MATVAARRRRLIWSTSRRKATASSAPSSPARAMKARMSLGRQPPAEAEAGRQEALADARVVADRLGQLRDVGAGRLAHLGHGVDERDLGGQEGVGGHLDQLGGREVRDEEGGALGDDRGVDLAQEISPRASECTPTTSRSGCRVSSTAKPSRRNSGFQATSTSGGARSSRAGPRSRAAVPTGTVDLPTTRAPSRRCGVSAATDPKTWVMSAFWAPAAWGVPTQMKCTSAKAPTSSKEVVKRRRPASMFRARTSSRPGS